MKKLFLFLALIAYTFSDDCDKCFDGCLDSFIGEDLKECVRNCIFYYYS